MQHQIYFCNIYMKQCHIHLKHLKHTVATCAHLVATPQWRLVHAEFNARVELKVAHSRQADGLWHGGRHKTQVRVRDARHEVHNGRHGASTSIVSFGARHEARG
jgi:hypothetical protein